MAEKKNQPGLMQKIKSLCNKSNLTLQTLNNTNEKAFTSHIKQFLRRAQADHQLTLLKTNRKLTFYSSFKNDTKKGTFLDMIKNPQHRIAITKLRLGNHHLHIETGRHSIPKTPENLRLCSFSGPEQQVFEWGGLKDKQVKMSQLGGGGEGFFYFNPTQMPRNAFKINQRNP